MKHWTLLCILMAAVLFTGPTLSHASVSNGRTASLRVDERPEQPILASAQYRAAELKEGFAVLVGRLVLHRQFMGTRAEPAYVDSVRFRFFDGSDPKFISFNHDAEQRRMIEQLKAGRSLPAVLTVEVEKVRVGHDGINMRDRLVTRVQACTLTEADLIIAAAKEVGFDEAACDAFARDLEPDAEQQGVVVVLGGVSVRPKIEPGWKTPAVFVGGIRVFNNTDEDATIEIVGLSIEQDGVKQQCPLNQTTSPRSWRVAAGTWSNGIYEQGKMPKTRWTFDPTKPIDPEKPVSAHLQIKINNGEPITLKRTVEPMSLKR